MNKELTIENMNRELLRLMNENPDFKYIDTKRSPDEFGDCHYFRGSKNGPQCEGCIFGQALQALGVKEDCFVDTANTGDVICDVWKVFTGTTAPMYWNMIQNLQDAGEPWGDLRYLLPNNK